MKVEPTPLRLRLRSPGGLILLIGLLLVAVALAAWLLLVVLADRNWQRLQQGGALRVAIDPSFPPFDSVDAKGEAAGFDVDLARDLAQRIGVPIEFKSIAFDGLVDAVIAGKVDVVISAFPLDPRLTQDVRYSQPYFEAGLVLVVPEYSQASSVQATTDLIGRKVAVEWGSQGDAWGREQGLDVLRLETPGEALNAAASGDADAAIVDAVTAALSLPVGLVVRQPPLTSEPYVIILPRRAGKLADALDRALAQALTDGTWEGLARAYFPAPPVPPVIATPATSTAVTR